MRPESTDHSRGLEALEEIARLVTGEAAQDVFVASLCNTVARLVGASKVILFQLQPDATIRALPGGFGIPEGVTASFAGIPCQPGAGELIDRIVFEDLVFRADYHRADEAMAPYRPWLDLLDARNAIGVSWRAGLLRLGMLGIYGSINPAGFSGEDVWVAQVSAIGAGLVWQQHQLTAKLMDAKDAEMIAARELADRMSALERTKSDLLNLAAHELRGPLTVVRGYLSMIEEGSLAGPALSRILPTLVGKAHQMDLLVTQMLEAARLEEGLLRLDRAEFDLGQTVRRAVDTAGLLAAPGQWVMFAQPQQPVRVHGDPGRIATVIANLIDNAIKYSPDGGAVTCSLAVEDGRALVKVRDQGLGIAAEDLSRLFTRFGRILTSENSHIPGTGLGLHICQALAHMHGGEISVESELGRGSTFTLNLPLAPAGL